jgi:type II secretory pathway predicted ATPase ExeA
MAEPKPREGGLSEAAGRAVLARVFAAAGYACREDQVVTIDDHAVTLDGWDAAARVGYEFITAEAQDEVEFTAAAIDALEASTSRGEIAVLLVDEHEALTGDALEHAARRFLERVKRGPPAAGHAPRDGDP